MPSSDSAGPESGAARGDPSLPSICRVSRRQTGGPGGRPVHSMASAGEWPSGKAADSGSANQRFESSLPSQCDVSGDGAHLSRDIVPDFWSAAGRSERLVVASGIDREFADESAVLVDDADVSSGD